MKVYVVTAGEYSGYHIAAVFTDKDLAYRYASLKTLQETYYEYDVEEWDTDEVKMEAIKNEEEEILPTMYYRCTFSKHGFLREGRDIVPRQKPAPIRKEWNDDIIVHVPREHNTPEQCVKIAQDMRAKYLAEKLNLF